MPINRNLFSNLSITDPTGLLNSFPQGYSLDKIQAELEEVDYLRHIAREKTQQIADDLGIDLENSSQPFSQHWDEEKKEVKLSAKLENSDAPVNGLFVYDGRTIETHIQTTVSNNDFNAINVREMFESVFQAGMDLAPTHRWHGNQYVQALKNLREQFAHGFTYPQPTRTYFSRAAKAKRAVIKRIFGSQDALTTAYLDEEDLEVEDLLDKIANTKLSKDSIDDICKALQQKAIVQDTDLSKILLRCRNLHKIFIGLMAIELWRAENPHTHQEIDRATFAANVKRIQEQQIATLSKTKRPIMVNIYKQEVENPDPDTAYYVLVTHKPNSDVSSASRTLESMMFSNDWGVTVETIKLKRVPNGSFAATRELQNQYTRSSSIARITYEDARAVLRGDKQLANVVDPKELNQVYKSFKQLVIQYAREEMIRRINRGESIEDVLRDNSLIIKEAYITLLSPLISKSSGQKYTPGSLQALMIKTVHENELAQLVTTRYCLERIQADTLHFDDIDATEILRRTKKHPVKNLTIARLKGLNIKHISYYSNYMVNKVGVIRSEALDLSDSNRRYFISGNKYRRAHILEYINSSHELQNEEVKALLAHIFTFDKPMIHADLEDFMTLHADIMTQCPKLGHVLRLYIDIESYFDDAKRNAKLNKTYVRLITGIRRMLGENVGEKAEQERIAASYLAAYKDQMLAIALGFAAHITCKSGVDRTGMFAAFVESLAFAIDIFNINKALLEENLLRSLKHGANRAVKCANLAGVAGLQLASNALVAMRKISTFLKEGMLAEIGRLGKTIFPYKRSDFELAKRCAQFTELSTQASMLLSSGHLRPPSQSAGGSEPAPAPTAGSKTTSKRHSRPQAPPPPSSPDSTPPTRLPHAQAIKLPPIGPQDRSRLRRLPPGDT